MNPTTQTPEEKEIVLPPTDGWSVYRLLKGDVVIYVGMTGNLSKRIGEHRAGGKYFDRATYVVFSTLEEAQEEERKLIRLLTPILNFSGNPQKKRTRSEKAITPFDRGDEPMPTSIRLPEATEIFLNNASAKTGLKKAEIIRAFLAEARERYKSPQAVMEAVMQIRQKEAA